MILTWKTWQIVLSTTLQIGLSTVLPLPISNLRGEFTQKSKNK